MVSPSTGPTSSETAPRTARKKTAAPSAPPRPIHTRAATSATPAASAISAGWRTARNCGTPKSNSAWNVERPISRPPISATWRSIAKRANKPRGDVAAALAAARGSPPGAAPPGRSASCPAPPISIRCVGPHSVTSWPKSRCQTSSSGKPASANAPQAAISTPPTGARQPQPTETAAAPGSLARHRHREHAGGEHAEEPGEDQVVGRVGERAGVAALVDVQRDVPVHAEQRGQERERGDGGRERRPARQPGGSLGDSDDALEAARPAGAIAGDQPEQASRARAARRRSRSRPGRAPRRRRDRRRPGWDGGSNMSSRFNVTQIDVT